MLIGSWIPCPELQKQSEYKSVKKFLPFYAAIACWVKRKISSISL